MYDAAGAHSENVSLGLSHGKKQNEYILTLVPSKEWISDGKRAFRSLSTRCSNRSNLSGRAFPADMYTKKTDGTSAKNTTTEHMYGRNNRGRRQKSQGETYIKYSLPTLREGIRSAKHTWGFVSTETATVAATALWA